MESHKRIELLVSPDEFFHISDIKRFADDSGLVGYVSAQSGAFGVKGHKFYFGDLARFASDIKQLHRSLSGSARLQTPFERDFVELSVDSLGHVLVKGHFELSGPVSQRLDFEFTCDQTFLPSLIVSLDAVLAETPKT